jgi:hypothetical protein
VFLLLAVASALGQDAAPAAPWPAASQSETDCSGFISGQSLSNDLYVFEGTDNDFHSPGRAWSVGDFVFLRSRSGSGGYAVGSEHTLVRSAKELMRVRWYDGQGGSIRSLGKPYEDVGRVKVTNVTPFGAIAQVTFACGPVMTGDLAIPFHARSVPTYTPTEPFDRFAPPNNKILGAITAGVNNAAYFGVGSMAYINLGSSDGVAPGQKFRTFHIIRETSGGGFTVPPEPPREITGELVVLTVEEKSSVAMVVRSTREIALGDGIEQE